MPLLKKAAVTTARAALMKKSQQTRKEEAAFVFHKYDEDKSGDIDEEQMAKCFNELGFSNARVKTTEAEIKEWVRREHRRADIDGDGKVSFDEFVSYYNQYIVGHRRVFEDVYELGALLGSGSFGSVMKAQRKDDPTMFVAVKKMTKEKGIKMDLLHNEIMIWEQLKHPNLVQLLDVFETDDQLYLVTEIMRGGDLFNQLVKVEHFSEAEAVVLSRQIVSAVAYLHENGVVHCDLKPSNILLKAPLSKDVTPVVKLADFGLSQLLAQASQEDPSDNPGAEDDLGDLSESAQSAPRKLPKLTEVCGTPDYFSPELVELAQHEKELELKESQGYSSPLDCWAVGCIIYELLSGSPPYQAKEEEVLFYKITENAMDFPKETFGAVSPEAKELILQFTKSDAADRISCSAALEHPWLATEKAAPNPLPQQTVVQNRRLSIVRREERKSKEITASAMAQMALATPPTLPEEP